MIESGCRASDMESIRLEKKGKPTRVQDTDRRSDQSRKRVMEAVEVSGSNWTRYELQMHHDAVSDS
jgi:hypothetical protein